MKKHLDLFLKGQRGGYGVRGKKGKEEKKKEKSSSGKCFRPQHHPFKS